LGFAELIMESKACEYPDWFTLKREGDRRLWVNRPPAIDHRLTFLDASTLPCGPFEYITR